METLLHVNQILQRWVKCSNGHHIRLEVKKRTPNLTQMIPCPVCRNENAFIVGDIVTIQVFDAQPEAVSRHSED
jgi:hypothetical protein